MIYLFGRELTQQKSDLLPAYFYIISIRIDARHQYLQVNYHLKQDIFIWNRRIANRIWIIPSSSDTRAILLVISRGFLIFQTVSQGEPNYTIIKEIALNPYSWTCL